jgi:hypothetical protein
MDLKQLHKDFIDLGIKGYQLDLVSLNSYDNELSIYSKRILVASLSFDVDDQWINIKNIKKPDAGVSLNEFRECLTKTLDLFQEVFGKTQIELLLINPLSDICCDLPIWTSKAEIDAIIAGCGFQTVTEIDRASWKYSHFNKALHLHYFIKVIHSGMFSFSQSFLSIFLATLSEIEEQNPTFFYKISSEKPDVYDFDFYGYTGIFLIEFKNNIFSLSDKNSKFLMTAPLDNFTKTSIRENIMVYFEEIKLTQRLENIFKPPMFHFSCFVKNFVYSEKIEEQIYAYLASQHAPETIETMLAANRKEKIKPWILEKMQNNGYIGFVKIIDCYLVLDNYTDIAEFSIKCFSRNEKTQAIEKYKSLLEQEIQTKLNKVKDVIK